MKTKTATASKISKKAAAPASTKSAPAPKKRTPKAPAEATKASTSQQEKSEAREGSKKQIVLGLLRREEGATMAEIAKATDWQKHSIRGFISGTITKKMKLKVESTKNESGERTYRIN